MQAMFTRWVKAALFFNRSVNQRIWQFQGITLFEDLSSRNPEDKRDYIYYLAIGYTKLKQFQTAQKYVKTFLQIEPNNQQVSQLDVSIFCVLSLKVFIRLRPLIP